jgi:hypothetical protein
MAAIGATSAAAQSLPAGVDSCLALIRQQSNSAEAAPPARAPPTEPPLLGDLCPDLAEAINDGPWGEAIAGVWADQLSTSAFRELTELVPKYERPSSGEVELQTGSLDESLAALKLEKPTAELSIWGKIQRWFDEQFGARGGDTRSWLQKWLEHLSPSERVVRYLVLVLGIALVVATVIVVVNELRVAGVLAGDVPEDERVHDLDDVARAPLARRPVLLLALVLARLRERGKGSLRDSLTHRELVGAAAGLSGEQSSAFAAVVGAAERVTFGDWRPEQNDVDGIVARGRTLLASFAADEGAKR